MDRRKAADKGRLSFPPRNSSPKWQPSAASPSSTSLRWTPVRKAENHEDEDMEKNPSARDRSSSDGSIDPMKDMNEAGVEAALTPQPRSVQEETARAVALSTFRIRSTPANHVQGRDDSDSPSRPATRPADFSRAPPSEPSSNSAKRRARRNARTRLEETPHDIQDRPPPQPPTPPPADEGGRKEYRICMIHRRRRLIQHCIGHGTPRLQYSCRPESPCIPTSAMDAPHWQTQRHPLRTRERQTSAPPATTRRTRSMTKVNPEGEGSPQGLAPPQLPGEANRQELFGYSLYEAVDWIASAEVDDISLEPPPPQLRCLLPGTVSAMLASSGKDLQDDADMVATRITMALGAAIKAYIDKNKDEENAAIDGMDVTVAVRPKADDLGTTTSTTSTPTTSSRSMSIEDDIPEEPLSEKKKDRTVNIKLKHDSETPEYRACIICGCLEPFQRWTEECCWRERREPCIFPEPSDGFSNSGGSKNEERGPLLKSLSMASKSPSSTVRVVSRPLLQFLRTGARNCSCIYEPSRVCDHRSSDAATTFPDVPHLTAHSDDDK